MASWPGSSLSLGRQNCLTSLILRCAGLLPVRKASLQPGRETGRDGTLRAHQLRPGIRTRAAGQLPGPGRVREFWRLLSWRGVRQHHGQLRVSLHLRAGTQVPAIVPVLYTDKKIKQNFPHV
jgi:hypothetical protein